ncbi:hypothetical protein GCM10029964_065060 [Kibdelosporangium lantanae]
MLPLTSGTVVLPFGGVGSGYEPGSGRPVPVSATGPMTGPSDMDVVGGGSVRAGTVIPGSGDESMRTIASTSITIPAAAAHSARCDTAPDSSGPGPG